MKREHCGRLLFVTIIILATVVSSIVVTYPSSTARAAGTFSVQGSKIYDPNGNEFVIKGTNINGPNWVWPIEMTQYADVIATTWRFNLVRVNAILKGDNFHDNDNLDRIVNEFTSRNVVVLFEAHDWTGWAPSGDDLTLLTNWHTDLANRYKNNTYVWFNIFNEPYYCQNPVPQEWLTVHQTVISAIRNTGANNIVVADGHSFGSEQGCNGGSDLVPTEMSAVLTYGDDLTNQFSNVTFAFHPYCWGDEGKMSNYLDRTQAANLAVFVGEFGVAGGENCNSQPTTEAMYTVVKPRNIGRVVWHFYGGDENRLTDTPNPSGGWKINDPINPTNLTWLGQQVWNDTHSTSAGSLPNGTYKIVSRATGKVIDVSGVSYDNGALIHQWTYVGGGNQKWNIEHQGDGIYRLTAVHSGKVLDVTGSSTTDGVQLSQWDWHGNNNQRFRILSVGSVYYQIISVHSEKAVDVRYSETHDGNAIQQYTINSSFAQQWRFDAV